MSRDLYRKGYLENLTEFHRKLASLNCGPLVDLRLAIAWDYLYNFPDYEAAVKITEPLLSVVPTMNPTTRSLFYRLRIDSLITTGRKEQALNMLVSGCDQGILSYADLGHTSFEQLKDHFGKNGPAAMAKKADAAHLKCIAEVRKDYFDKLAKKELPDPRLIARVAHDDVYSRGDCGEALTITAPLLKMDSETIDPSLRAQIIATQTAARKEANSTVCRGSGKICSQSQQTRGNSSTILIREKALMRATEMVLLYDYDTARQEYARWLAPNAGRLSTGEIARALFGKERDPSLDDLTQLAILEEALYLASTLTENCSQNLQAGEVMTIVSDLFLRYAAEKKWDDCLRISRRGRYALQWTSDASVAAGLDTRLGIAQYQQFQHPRFLQQMNLNYLSKETWSSNLIRIYVGECLCSNRQYKEALAVTDPLMNKDLRNEIPLIHSERLRALRERCSSSACHTTK